MGRAPHDDEDGISDEEKSELDPEEVYTAVRSVVSIPKQAAEEAQENPKVAELKERLINAYPRLFSGVANKNPPDRGRFGTAKIKLKPNPKIYRHREYQLQGDRAEAMKNPPTVSGPAQPLSCQRRRRASGGWWWITGV